MANLAEQPRKGSWMDAVEKYEEAEHVCGLAARDFSTQRKCCIKDDIHVGPMKCGQREWATEMGQYQWG